MYYTSRSLFEAFAAVDDAGGPHFASNHEHHDSGHFMKPAISPKTAVITGSNGECGARNSKKFASGYYMTAELRVKDDQRVEETLDALSELSEITRSEPGCRLFMLHQDLSDPQRLFLWERWDDEAALATHLASAHTQAYFALDLTEVRLNVGTAALL
jgi:4-carboxymuconolactone decarboxylase